MVLRMYIKSNLNLQTDKFQFVELIDPEENAIPTSVQVGQEWVFEISAKLSESDF